MTARRTTTGGLALARREHERAAHVIDVEPEETPADSSGAAVVGRALWSAIAQDRSPKAVALDFVRHIIKEL
jgi:hypothetical protein